MNRRFLWVFLAIWGCWGGLRAAEPESGDSPDAVVAEVGGLGELSRLEFVGVRHFTDDALRRALSLDVKLQAACRPSSPLPPLIELLERVLAEGYAHSGCPGTTAEVTLADDGENLVAHVAEQGFRTAGQLRIEGLDEPLTDAIRVCLTTPGYSLQSRLGVYFFRDGAPLAHQGKSSAENWDEEESALWEPEGPLRSSEFQLAKIRQAVCDVLAVRGYVDADFAVTLKPVDETHTDLIISVKQLNAPATLGKIELDGLERHDRDEVLEFAGLSEDRPYDVVEILEAHDRLQNSCRFWYHAFVVHLPDKETDAESPKVRLNVRLMEYVHVAKLGEPLADEDEALRQLGLKFLDFPNQAQWDLKIKYRWEDSTLTRFKVDADVILSPGRGVILQTEGLCPRGESVIPWNFTFIATADQFGLADSLSAYRWSLPKPIPLTVKCKLYSANREEGEYKSGLRSGIGLGRGHSQVAAIDWHMSPILWVNEAHRDGAKVRWNDKQLIVSSENAVTRIDRETGQLIEVITWDRDGMLLTIKPVPRDAGTGEGSRYGGEFENRIIAFQSLPESYQQDRPLASLVDAVLKSSNRFSVDQPVIPAGVKELLLQFTRAEAVRRKLPTQLQSNPDARKFELAVEESRRDDSWEQTVAPMIAPLADYLFVRESWPWTMVREKGIGFANMESGGPQQEGMRRDVERMMERDDISVFLIWYGSMFGKRDAEFAQLGSHPRVQRNFQREVEMLTTPDTGMMKLLATVVPVVQGLPEEDTNWLCGLAGDDMAPKLEEVTRLLRKLDASSDEALQQSLRALLEGEIRERVEADLRAAAAE